MDTINNDLCDLCLQALTIDDKLAGGTVYENTGGTTGLDLCGFTLNHWKTTTRPADFEVREERSSINLYLKDGKDLSGTVSSTEDSISDWKWTAMFCAGNHHERLVTLPGMLELSILSAAGTCRLCSRLKVLFIEQYGERSWWNEHASTLRFIMRYEWGKHGEATHHQSKRARLDRLAVSVIHPGHKANDVADVYLFDIAAWSGTCLKAVILYSHNDN